MSRPIPLNTFDRKQLLFLLLALVALYVVVPQIGIFSSSFSLLSQADAGALLVGALYAAGTYFAAAGTYSCLALHPLIYSRTLLIQVAGMFLNRLLPAGIGGMGVNYVYLKKSHHRSVEAASVVAANNGLGIIGHGLLLLMLLLFYHQSLPPLELWHIHNPRFLAAISGIVVVAWAIFYYQFKQRLSRSIRSFVRELLLYRQRKRRLLAALACSMALTLSNVLSLWFCVNAFGGHLSFLAVFLVFTFGIALGTATPTPGGLGGVEAGLVAGLVIYHLNGATALGAVLAYRLLTFWLPLIAGGVAFIYSQRKGYV